MSLYAVSHHLLQLLFVGQNLLCICILPSTESVHPLLYFPVPQLAGVILHAFQSDVAVFHLTGVCHLFGQRQFGGKRAYGCLNAVALSQKATCHWRGRDFEAWFAPDIPVRLGPWSFGGLPGLILKLYDTQRLYTWEAVSLRSGTFPITKRKYEGFHKDSREHVYKLQVAANRDYLKTGGARDRVTGQLKSKVFPYDPLELE